MTATLKNIKSSNTHDMTGRGIVKSVQLNQGPFAVGDELIIDEVKYVITGIELARGLFGLSKNVGLAVRPL